MHRIKRMADIVEDLYVGLILFGMKHPHHQLELLRYEYALAIN